MNNSEQPHKLLEFPCEFPIKIFGAKSDDFRAAVEAIRTEHVKDEHHIETRENVGKGGKYLAFTILIMAQNQAQLDAIYQALSDEATVVMAL